MAKRVFQVAYDRGLMTTRELLLKSRGYTVDSVFGDEAARAALKDSCNYDLVIVGHKASSQARRSVAEWLKTSFPMVKILSLNPSSWDIVPFADYNVPLNGPEEWLRAVAAAIG